MKKKLKKPIVLVGMMGSGKSTVGRKLAKKIDLRFYDSDNIIEGREGLSITDIHEYMGQKYFQEKEEETIKEILDYGNIVLSTGGGSFSNPNIRNIIKEKATCIWLDANINTILERVSRRNTRPELIGKNNKEVIQDVELLASQVERCNQILRKLSLEPNQEDDFIDEDLTMKDYIREIVFSFQETSTKNFIVNFDQDSNSKKITKSIEIVYGLRNFIGNANKFSQSKIFITLKSDNEFTEIIIEDDGFGYPYDVLSKIGEPYLKSLKEIQKDKSGLGLGLFIGKTLLEKNFAFLEFRNSKTRGGAEVIIKWKNKDLFNV